MKETFLIVGLGSIGKRHLECLRLIKPKAEIIVWHQHSKSSVAPEGADAVVFNLQDALDKRPSAAIISNPAPMHVETGKALAVHGIHLLIEKPLSISMAGIDQLLSICREQKSILMVAYVLRFNEALRCFKAAVQNGLIGRVVSVRTEIGQYLPDWRPGMDYRQSVSAKEDLGGGALLELSHELDYMRWIFGEVLSVAARIEKTGLLEIDTDDLVELTLEQRGSHGKIISNIHLDMLQQEAHRSCKAIGEKGILEWDAIANSVRYFSAQDKCWKHLFKPQKAIRNSMYLAQLEAFFGAIEGGQKVEIAGEDGLAVMEIIDSSRESSARNKTVFLS